MCICVQAVQQFTKLRLLELGSNKVKRLEGLDGLVKLHELWLGRNRISEITGLNRSAKSSALEESF